MREQFIQLFSFAYHTMRASVPLLEFAIQHTDSKELCAYFERHHAEEQGHDQMLLTDLNNLGVGLVPLPHFAAQFAGAQYYLIAHEHPALLLGYMRALESESMSVADVDALSTELGVELTALRHHAIHDPQHLKDLDAIIGAMDEWARDRIEWNERETRALMERLDREIFHGSK